MKNQFDIAKAKTDLASRYELKGEVLDATGLLIEANGPRLSVGSNVSVVQGTEELQAQIVGFKKERTLLMPYGEPQGISPGALVKATDGNLEVNVSEGLLGRVINALGEPIDGKGPIFAESKTPLYQDPPNPVFRKRIDTHFDVGVKAINTMLTIGKGQRVGIMAGSGVGKSTLLGMIARNSTSDINVIALVGERGREVREFIERDLGEEGLKRSVVIVATGNESALLRIRGALFATAVSEFFRDKGKHVVLMVDSVTRLAMAQREVGLAVGEPPSTKGYTPSVFSLLPKVLERAGTSQGDGAITGLYTVLVEGDDMNEPIADAVRGILDGHIVLSRRLASKAHYPAIEVLESVSRIMNEIVQPELIEFANHTRDMLATYKEAEDLITIGAYKEGQNPKLDQAVSLNESLVNFLCQKPHEAVSIEEAWQGLIDIYEQNLENSEQGQVDASQEGEIASP